MVNLNNISCLLVNTSLKLARSHKVVWLNFKCEQGSLGKGKMFPNKVLRPCLVHPKN